MYTVNLQSRLYQTPALRLERQQQILLPSKPYKIQSEIRNIWVIVFVKPVLFSENNTRNTLKQKTTKYYYYSMVSDLDAGFAPSLMVFSPKEKMTD